MRRPTVPDVQPLLGMIYRDHSAGCCLHIAADDGNWSDHNLEFCVRFAKKERHLLCHTAAVMLLGMTQTQRHFLYHHRYPYTQS